MLTACGGGNSNSKPPATPDTVPDIYSFTDQTDVALNTIITSDSIIVTGIDTATTISVTDGEYSIDDGAFTQAQGSVTNGQTVRVRHLSSSVFSTITTTLLSIGGVNGTFTSTTGAIGTGFNKALSFNDIVRSISPAIDGSGDIYVGGEFNTYNTTRSSGLIRLNRDGTVDTAFNVGDGFDSGGGFYPAVFSINPATDGSGDLYIGGRFDTYNGVDSSRLIRLNSDGTVDAEFNVGSGFDGHVTSITPAADGSGKLYVGGFVGNSYITQNITGSNGLIRFLSDGSVDTTFNVGSGFSNHVWSVSPATDGSGDLYVGGEFTFYNGVASNRIIRLNSDGTVDAEFDSRGSGFDYSVNSISPATDGSGDLFVGGAFKSYQSTTVDRIVRLNPDGSLN